MKLRQMRQIRSHYGEMLGLFEGVGVMKKEWQTPLEFVEEVRVKQPECVVPASKVTDQFCLMRYGGELPSGVSEREVHQSLLELKEILSN